MSTALFPLFAKLSERDVVVVGGGAMAALRVRQLVEVGARVTVVAPEIRDDVADAAKVVHRRPFREHDLDGAWFAVAAATPLVNAQVARAAEARRILLNAVDDPERATAYTAGVVRRGDATIAVSTGGRAPALAGLLREAIDAVLPADASRWVEIAEGEREGWKRERVPLATRRPMLLRKLDALYGGERERALRLRPSGPRAGRTDGGEPSGSVALVGAGPGDPGLLTRRAAEVLAEAELVLYDALVDATVLKLAPRAHCFFVGKRGGRPSVSQRAIERLMVRAARRGRRVVRLKCGDPFVFGRGGEEVAALAEAGIAWEVVPGVTSAIAAPALAGIPVTHRGLASGFVVVSGHSEAACAPTLDSLAPGAATVVVLMGLSGRAGVAARLLRRGWEPSTPAAVLLGASSAAAHTWTGPLGELGSAALPADRADLPGILIVGAVAALARSRFQAPAVAHDVPAPVAARA